MKCGGIYKVIVIGFLMCLLCSQGFAGNGKGPGNGLKEAIESAVRAAKKDSKGLFKEAEAKLAKMINII